MGNELGEYYFNKRINEPTCILSFARCVAMQLCSLFRSELHLFSEKWNNLNQMGVWGGWVDEGVVRGWEDKPINEIACMTYGLLRSFAK